MSNNTAKKNHFVLMEEQVLNFWDKAEIFKKSLEKESPNGDYVFYDGPPFGTGEPHYGHILSSVAKDVVPRYWTMKGYKVARRWGWDCHGLPIENIIEKEMNISGKKQIEEVGIAKFNEACRSQVLKYADVWDVMVRRIGRWVDFKNSYKTMDTDFMESVWWGFKKLWDKDLVYEGRKVLLYCPRCETPISNFEVAMDNSYKDIKEISVYVKFKVNSDVIASAADAERSNPENGANNTGLFTPSDDSGPRGFASRNDSEIYILAWTTTPWTLPGNVALAVGSSIKYQVLSIKGENNSYIIAKDRVEQVFEGEEYEVVQKLTGKDLVGLSYEPLFDVPALREAGKENTYTVQAADFVTTEDGTGVVHTAVVYGEDDYNLGKELDLPVIPALDEKGHFNETVPQYTGMYFKKANKQIIKDLEESGKLFKPEEITHSYPHCHRCDTQLFYNAIPAWFINIDKIRKDLVEQNENINWYPKHLKHGRFKNGLEGAPDWNISRNRYFATPMPIWRCDKCEDINIISSIKELEEKANLGSFYIMRHGTADSNVQKRLNSDISKVIHLTDKGKAQAEKTAQGLKGKGIELVITSDFIRTKETARIVAVEIGADLVEDKRLREVNFGEYEDANYDDVWDDYISKRHEGRDIAGSGGETLSDVKNRVADFYKDISLKYKGKKILVVSHGDPLVCLESYLSDGDYFKNVSVYYSKDKFIDKAEVRELKHRITDIHSHFIDNIKWTCTKCNKGVYERIPEVFDCWVESGSMAFAEHHYMGEALPQFDPEKGVRFPAQYISEYISQTRAWFYVMHVMSVALFGKNSYENVVTTGVVLNEEGHKMSKSKKNYPDPWKVIDAYGVDALRLYLMSSSIMHAENLFFNEKELLDLFRKNIMLLWNVFKFYDMFTPRSQSEANTGGAPNKPDSSNILDRWVLARLDELVKEVTDNMDNYDLPRASRPIGEFIDDLSTWYLRRSRDRFKGEDQADKQKALETTRYVLITLSKIIAPFMPFMAETVWQKVSGFDFADNDKSVHLEEFPVNSKQTTDDSIIKEMEDVRRVVELALAKRDEEKIKIRQPLNKLRVTSFKLREEYIQLIKDEVNVKDVEFIDGNELSVVLDTELTPELVVEGRKRELVRNINSMRKKENLTIGDSIKVEWQGSDEIEAVFDKFADDIKKETITKEITRINNDLDGKEFNVNGEKVVIGIGKV